MNTIPADDLFCYAEQLQQKHPYTHIKIVEQIDSTQTQVASNSVLIANSQQSGIGRRGNNWYSPPGESISLSIRFGLPVALSELSGYQLTIGLAITDCLYHFDCHHPRLLKWPNDLCFNGEKFGGILINLSPKKTTKETELIVGIGLNWRLSQSALTQINQAVCNVPLLHKPDRGLFINHLLHNIQQSNRRFVDDGLTPFLDQWAEQDSLDGQQIRVKQNHQTIVGNYLGLNERGELQLERDGQIECFGSGEVSVRPLKMNTIMR